MGAGVPVFARGQIDGYFDGHVPDDFWRSFSLIPIYTAHSSCPMRQRPMAMVIASATRITGP